MMLGQQETKSVLPDSVQAAIDGLAQLKMATPLALFVIGHRPLAFVAGQLCHLLDPVSGLLGVHALHDWATVLSDPVQTACLAEALDDVA